MRKEPIPFLEGVKIQVKDLVDTVPTNEGVELDYLSWLTALALAGRPQFVVDHRWEQYANFRGPYFRLFDGGVVSVSSVSHPEQQVFLPILGPGSSPVPRDAITSRDVADTVARARAKAIAMHHGVGLCLYSGFRDVKAFLKALNIRPDSDLSEVEPWTRQASDGYGKTYIPWGVAFAAAKITDPSFSFTIGWQDYETVDSQSGELVRGKMPAYPVGDGWAVEVTVHWKRQSWTEMLPIMGMREVQTRNGPKVLDHQPLTNPTVADWNRAVMRCLTKAIAIVTGYGLALYADQERVALDRYPIQPQKSQTEPAPDPARSYPDFLGEAARSLAVRIENIINAAQIPQATAVIEATQLTPDEKTFLSGLLKNKKAAIAA